MVGAPALAADAKTDTATKAPNSQQDKMKACNESRRRQEGRRAQGVHEDLPVRRAKADDAEREDVDVQQEDGRA